jgi:hypothetical protein
MKKEGKKVRRLDTFHNSDKCQGKVIIEFIYLVEGFEFWIEGVCSECEARVRSTIPLEQLILMTPNPENKPFLKPPLQKQFSKEDFEFLKNLGIGGGDETDETPRSTS